MSTRPFAASIRGVNDDCTPPWRMNVPSCTLRTRSSAGLKVSVSVIDEMRDALLIDTGIVYGPFATRTSFGAVTITCADVDGGGFAAGGVVGGAATSRAGGVAGVVPAGGLTGVTCGAVAPGSGCVNGGVVPVAPGGGMKPGTADVPGGGAAPPTPVCEPGGPATGGPGTPACGAFGIAAVAEDGWAPAAGAVPGAPAGAPPGAASGTGAISGGGPVRPTFDCVPI